MPFIFVAHTSEFKIEKSKRNEAFTKLKELAKEVAAAGIFEPTKVDACKRLNSLLQLFGYTAHDNYLGNLNHLSLSRTVVVDGEDPALPDEYVIPLMLLSPYAFEGSYVGFRCVKTDENGKRTDEEGEVFIQFDGEGNHRICHENPLPKAKHRWVNPMPPNQNRWWLYE